MRALLALVSRREQISIELRVRKYNIILKDNSTTICAKGESDVVDGESGSYPV